jgi:hypothetical protein
VIRSGLDPGGSCRDVSTHDIDGLPPRSDHARATDPFFSQPADLDHVVGSAARACVPSRIRAKPQAPDYRSHSHDEPQRSEVTQRAELMSSAVVEVSRPAFRRDDLNADPEARRGGVCVESWSQLRGRTRPTAKLETCKRPARLNQQPSFACTQLALDSARGPRFQTREASRTSPSQAESARMARCQRDDPRGEAWPMTEVFS